MFCVGVSFVFLYGLFDVQMVYFSHTRSLWVLLMLRAQATVLYPCRDCCSTFDYQFSDRLYHFVGPLSFWCLGGSSYASAGLGIYRYGTFAFGSSED